MAAAEAPRVRRILVLIAVALLGACSSSSGGIAPSPSAATSPSALPRWTPVARHVLPPARTLPVVALCSAPAVMQADGTTGPLFCPDGALNALAWLLLQPESPRVLSAGPNVSLKNLQIALCADVNLSHAKVPQEVSAYAMAAAYYGWTFGADPSDSLATSGCPR